MSKFLDLSDVSCHICFGILMEPVTMPCNHSVCKECFDRSIEVNRLTCPLCKHRINIWCRRNANNLVNQDLWKKICDTFPERVSLRKAGIEPDDADELFPCVPTHLHATQGEIGEEFRRFEVAEREAQRHKMAQCSSDVTDTGNLGEAIGISLNDNLLREQEEALKKIEQERKDEELAKSLSEQFTQTSTSPAIDRRVLKTSNTMRNVRASPMAAKSKKDSKGLRQLSLQESFRFSSQ